MAGSTPGLGSRRSGVVLRMVELNIERFIESGGKTFQWRISAGQGCMTNGAHRNIRGNKLGKVATCARVVAWAAWRSGIVGTRMAGGACERRVSLAVVLEA